MTQNSQPKHQRLSCNIYIYTYIYREREIRYTHVNNSYFTDGMNYKTSSIKYFIYVYVYIYIYYRYLYQTTIYRFVLLYSQIGYIQHSHISISFHYLWSSMFILILYSYVAPVVLCCCLQPPSRPWLLRSSSTATTSSRSAQAIGNRQLRTHTYLYLSLSLSIYVFTCIYIYIYICIYIYIHSYICYICV